MKLKPNKKLIRAWVKRLRSPRSKQHRGALKETHSNAYCCLGHACVVAEPNSRFTKDQAKFGKHYLDAFLPEGLAEVYFGASKMTDPVILVSPAVKKAVIKRDEENDTCNDNRISGNGTISCSTANDDCELSLKEIADCIEYTFLKKRTKEQRKQVALENGVTW